MSPCSDTIVEEGIEHGHIEIETDRIGIVG
jgi:hypothetical protein